MSVTIAYCIELERNISIIEARNEYFAQNKTYRQTFTFLCSDPSCVQAGNTRTEIIGVNYTKIIGDSEDKKYKSPYFRLKPKQVHKQDVCVWLKNEDKAEASKEAQDTASNTRYTSTPKENLFIDKFILPSDDHSGHESIKKRTTNTNTASSINKSEEHSKNSVTGSSQNLNTTSVLDTLVYSYIELKNLLPHAELSKRKLIVKKQGSVKLIDYFSSLSFVLDKINQGDYQGIAYGGCTIQRIYGNTNERFGLSLRFYDKFNDKPILLYLSVDMVQNFRYRNTLAEIISATESFDYLRVYLLNPKLKFSKKHQSYNIEINDLRFVTFIPTMKKKHSAQL